ncbi:solute:sodium symporters [Klebsormidium nitens]|uniref:Solute:sodium symporters n=1 Tax=Klebsormidium nitens TaxID=105231 RepID=A0A1Y1IAL7_KLENI|nr:solute:sodium symporters [Klebsormidium nitens]|eukprot:GAQ85757.1 solute:sodium symporters [Klebsormidium nitens]
MRQASFFEDKHVLSLGFGYMVVLGLGLFFSVFTAALVQHGRAKFQNGAHRQCYCVPGISGPFWYASGATVQVLLFGVMAIEIKRKAPTAHTICEVVRARAESTWIAVKTASMRLTDLDVEQTAFFRDLIVLSFLKPLGVIFYTLSGGLKATFLASYVHSIIIHIALMMFIWIVYATDSDLGSPKAVYNALKAVSSKTRDCLDIPDGQKCGPVAGNHKGTYLTMLSNGGLTFGIINIVGNFGTVFVDNGYWQSAIAARPSSSHKGYLLGGLVWFAVPFALASSLGLAAVALDLPLTADEANAGLLPPAAAIQLMGQSGAGLLLVMLFMAVTSAGSAELIAVSSLITYDIYRTYINPKASGKQILAVSRYCVLGFGLFMGVLAIALQKAGVSLGWMYEAMGCLIGSAVFPVAFLLLWRKANAIGALAGAIIGMIAGVITWLVVAQVDNGALNLYTTGKDGPMLAGNLVSILTGGIIHITSSLIWPQNFDWDKMKQITLVENDASDLPDDEYDPAKLAHAKWWIIKWGCTFSFVMLILWPVATLPAREFGIVYWTFWVVIVLAWGTIASVVIIVLPLYESWAGISLVLSGLFTSDVLYKKVEDLDAKIDAIIRSNPSYEAAYLHPGTKEVSPPPED